MISQRWLPCSFLLLLIFGFFCRSTGLRRSFSGIAGGRTDSHVCPPAENVLPCVCVLKITEIHIRCENSEIEKVGAALESLKRAEVPVEELYLAANRIPSIPARFFASLQIKKLFLIDNELVGTSRNALAGLESSIEQIYIHESILQDLPFDTFDNLRKLRTLILEETAIIEIPRLFSLPQLEFLKVDQSHVSNLPNDAFTHMPSMKKIQIINSNLQNLGENAMEGLIYLKEINFANNNISWVHPGAFRTLEMVDELSFAGNKIEEVAAVVMATRELRSLRVLDISRNKIRQLKQGTFMDMPNLEVVNLAHNHIQKIHPEAMFKLPNLKKLDLSNNELVHFEAHIFTDVASLEYLSLASNNISFLQDMRYIYRNLPNLRELDLSGNYLKGGKEIFFGGHSKLETLILSYNFVAELSNNLFRSLPNLRELYLSHNLIKSAEENQIWDLPKLRVLDISHNDLEKIEPSMVNGLPKLNELKLCFNLIAEIFPKTFDNSTYLKYLNISYNKLTKLHPNTFNHVSDLYELDISYNNLVALEAALFDGLSSLEFLHAFHNQIMTIDGLAFKDTVKLRHLDLSENLLKMIPAEALRRLTSLRTLKLQSNAINSVYGGVFNHLRVIESLDLSNNHIQTLDHTAFNDMNVLKYLDLSVNFIQYLNSNLFTNVKLIEKINMSNNFITEIGHDTFKNAKRLRILDLTNNSLTTIGQALQDLPLLQGLFMNHNYISKLTNSTFINLPSLNVLFFGNNGLQTFEIGTFYNLTSLMFLDLRNNSLVELKSYSFSSLGSLKELKLPQNQISLIEDYAFINLGSLQTLELQDNVITHIGDYAFDTLPSLKFLNLSRNGLQSIPEKPLNRIQTLDVLDLSWNYVLEIKDSSFRGLQWLTVLILNDNDLCHLSAHAFKGPRSLRVLMLHNNQMKKLHLSALREPIRSLSLLDMSGNPFMCDCELVWLREYLQEEETQMNHIYNVQNIFRGSSISTLTGGRALLPNFPSTMHGEPQCAGPPEFAGRPITGVPPEAFLCNSLREETGLGRCVPRFLNPSAFTLGESGLSPELLNTLLRLSNLTEVLPLEGEAPSYLDYNNPIVVSSLPYQRNSSSPLSTNKVTTLLTPAQSTKPLYDVSLSQLTSGVASGLGGVSNDFVTGDTPTIYAAPSPQKSSSSNDESPKTNNGGLFGFKLPALPNILESLGKFKLPNLGLNVDWGQLPFGRLEGASPARGPDKDSPIWVQTSSVGNHLPNSNLGNESEEGLFPPRRRGNGSANGKLFPIFSEPITTVEKKALSSINKSSGTLGSKLKPPLEWPHQEQHPSHTPLFGPGPNSGTPFLPGLLHHNPFTQASHEYQSSLVSNSKNPDANANSPKFNKPQNIVDGKEKWPWSHPEVMNPASGVSIYPPTTSFRPMKTYDPNSPIVVVEGPNTIKDAPIFYSNSANRDSSHNSISMLSNKVSSTTADFLSSEMELMDTVDNRPPTNTGETPLIYDHAHNMKSETDGSLIPSAKNVQQPHRPPFHDPSSSNRGVGSVINVDLEEYGRKSSTTPTNSNPVNKFTEDPISAVTGQPMQASSSIYDHWTKPQETDRRDFSFSTIPSTNSTVINLEDVKDKLSSENRTFVPLNSLNSLEIIENASNIPFNSKEKINWLITDADDINSSQSSNEGKSDANTLSAQIFGAQHIPPHGTTVEESHSWWPPSSFGDGVSLVQTSEDTVSSEQPLDSDDPVFGTPSRTGMVQAVNKGATFLDGAKQVSPSRSVGKFSAISSVEKVVEPNFVQGIDLPPQYEELEERPAIEIITEASPDNQNIESIHKKKVGNMDWYFSNYYREYDPEGQLPIGGNGPPPSSSVHLNYDMIVIMYTMVFHLLRHYKYI